MREILSRLLATGGRLRSAVSRDESDGDQLATDGGATVKTTRGDSLRNSLPVEWELIESAPFWLPPVLLAGFFVYGAIAWNFLLSLTEYNGLGGAQYESFDLSMYSRMLSDGAFWQAAQNTVVLLVVFTVLCLALGLFVAILIDQQIRFENTFRTIYLLPMSLSFVVTATMWAWVYNARNGVLNQFFRVFNLEGAIVGLLRPPESTLRSFSGSPGTRPHWRRSSSRSSGSSAATRWSSSSPAFEQFRPNTTRPRGSTVRRRFGCMRG